MQYLKLERPVRSCECVRGVQDIWFAPHGAADAVAVWFLTRAAACANPEPVTCAHTTPLHRTVAQLG